MSPQEHGQYVQIEKKERYPCMPVYIYWSEFRIKLLNSDRQNLRFRSVVFIQGSPDKSWKKAHNVPTRLEI